MKDDSIETDVLKMGLANFTGSNVMKNDIYVSIHSWGLLNALLKALRLSIIAALSLELTIKTM